MCVGGGGEGGTPIFLNWVIMKNALKICRSVTRGGSEEMHHIPLT